MAETDDALDQIRPNARVAQGFDALQSQQPAAKPATPPPADPMTDILMPQSSIDDLVAKRSKLTQDTVSDITRLDEQRMRLASTPTARPALPKFQDVPKPPDTQFHNVFKDSAPGLIFATVLGSMMSRKHGMGAMAAATGYMEGFHKGDQEKMEHERQKWQDNVDAIIKQNDIESKRYDAVWSNAKLGMADKQAQINAIAASIGDKTTMNSLRSGDIDFAAKLQEQRTTAALKLRDIMNKQFMKPEQLALHRFIDAHPDATPEQIQEFIRSGKAGRSPAAIALLKYMEENPGATSDDISKFNAKLATDKISGSAEAKAESSSLTQLVQGKNALEAFEKTAIGNLDQLLSLARKVDMTGVPAIERWVRAGRQATGDPDVAAFNSQWTVVVPELARIITQPRLVGQLTDTARHEVQEALPKAANVKQLEAISGVLRGDIDRRNKSLDDQIAKVRGKLGGKTQEAPAPAAPADDTGGWKIERIQ